MLFWYQSLLLLFGGILGFFFGCTGSVTGGGVNCVSDSMLPLIEFMQGFGYMIGIYGIWFVAVPSLLVGSILKLIGQKVKEQSQDITQLDTAVSSSGSLLKSIILLGLASLFWWITVPLYLFFIIKNKSIQLGNERFKKIIFG